MAVLAAAAQLKWKSTQKSERLFILQKHTQAHLEPRVPAQGNSNSPPVTHYTPAQHCARPHFLLSLYISSEIGSTEGGKKKEKEKEKKVMDLGR